MVTQVVDNAKVAKIYIAGSKRGNHKDKYMQIKDMMLLGCYGFLPFSL